MTITQRQIMSIINNEYTKGNIIMAGAKILKQLLVERNMNVNELAERLGIKPQSMSNKLYRNNFSFDEMRNICDILNADLKAVTRDSQKEFYETMELKHNE